MKAMKDFLHPDELSREATALVRSAHALKVIDAETYAEAGERRKIVRLYLSRVDEVMRPIVEAAHRAHKVAVQQRDTLRKPALEADEIYKIGRLEYEDEQERLRREADARARKERERLEAQAVAAARAEQDRLQALEEERRLEAATDAEAWGDTETAERIIAEPIVIPAVEPAEVFVPPPDVAEPPKVEGITSRTDWDFEILDAALIPRAYLTVDLVKIRGVVRALKDQANIPGLRVFPRRNEAVRVSPRPS